MSVARRGMAAGKQSLLVVVWEWENKQRRWRPYAPEVTQQLERAFSKNLRSVFLGDSEPALTNYCIHLPQMEQEFIVTGERVRVRRSFFPQNSPAGQGAVWQWAGDVKGDWHTYDMCVQCVIEESWETGAQMLDMSKTFPACPYVINFCNLNQTNSKTGFVRSIRRVPQAAYPVGKPPVSPSNTTHSLHPQGSQAACSNSSSSSSKGAGTASHTRNSCGGEKLKRMGSREESENCIDNKPRAIMSKVLCLPKTTNAASHSHSEASGSSRHMNQHSCSNGSASSPPKPLPRSNVPPVPRPRTLPPSMQPSQPSSANTPTTPTHLTTHLLEDRDEPPDNSRIELSSGRFGSNHTLDSDCSSLLSGRRPSVDTISTYLSQDDDPAHPPNPSNNPDTPYMAGPAVEKLICVESDENMDEDVFAEDQEVCEVMRGVNGGASPHHRAPSPLFTPRQSRQFHNHHHVAQDTSQRQAAAMRENHFLPISAAQSGPPPSHINGVKRKRTKDRTMPDQSQYMSEDGSRRHQHPYSSGSGGGRQCHYLSGTSHKAHHGSRAPIAVEDRLLVQYTSVVECPPDDMCSICMQSLTEISGYLDDEVPRITQRTGGPSDGVVSLNLCKHQFHLACVREMARNSAHFLECPNCKTLHGEKIGNQPEGGFMNITTLHHSLPGHPDCNTLQITYSFSSGIQGPEHPHPGRPYRAIGFPRTAFIPNNDKGNKVVRLLQEAWRRRLIFTVGPSVTTGLDDCVTWNEIHHKTEWNNQGGHGYPDPGYLDNALKELELHGISETTLV